MDNKKHEEINKLFVGTFETELGQRCLEYLESVFVDRDIYIPGKSLEETSYRQGEASIVKKIRKALNKRSK